MTPVEATAWLQKLHAIVDGEAARLTALHGPRLQCRKGCSDCCVDGLTVFQVEAELLRSRHAELLARGQPHAPGRCAFLDEAGACRVYAERPYVCRTQGLPLRWLETEAFCAEEVRDVCPKNVEGTPPLELLPVDACWTVGPVEARLNAVQQSVTGEATRVSLRSLFEASGSL